MCLRFAFVLKHLSVCALFKCDIWIKLLALSLHFYEVFESFFWLNLFSASNIFQKHLSLKIIKWSSWVMNSALQPFWCTLQEFFNFYYSYQIRTSFCKGYIEFFLLIIEFKLITSSLNGFWGWSRGNTCLCNIILSALIRPLLNIFCVHFLLWDVSRTTIYR